MEIVSRVVALLLYNLFVASVAWTATRRFRPGLPRFLSCLPLFVLSFLPSTLFDRERGFEEILYYYSVTNYLWIVNCKLLALTLNRGPLTTYVHQPLLFTWLLVFPINVKPPHETKQAIHYSFHAMLRRLSAMVMGCLFFARMVVAFWEVALVRDFCLSWLMYCLLTTILELAASVSWIVLHVELMPHFNQPWLTTSISEFWAVRWNLVVGALLRELVYDPVLEGALVRRDPKKHKSRSQLRQLIAVLCTFVASGAMHWAVIYYIVHIHAWFNFASFCIHGGVVVMERCLGHLLHLHPEMEAQWNAVPWGLKAVGSQVLLHLIAHGFFWRDLVQCKEAWQLASTIDILHV